MDTVKIGSLSIIFWVITDSMLSSVWPCHDKRTRRILALPVCLDNLPVCLDNLLTLAGGRVLKNMSTVLESPDFDEEHASR